ncbi:type II secretion system protein N [Vibrio marinisediminis]|uniref:type II secretion system protein N n=1 Tax=Vibrio marinisediminis TaxID=2758441 RepID=UPI001C70C4ED|nr:type II secretion system protein N [Vibrio marinisediminis]
MAVKSKILLVVILVVAFVVSAVIHLPIQAVLAHAPLPNQLKIAGASGTLWQGQVQQLQWQQYNLGQVSWQLQPTKLLTGNLQAQVRLGRGNPWQLRARGVVGYGLQGAYAEDVIASMPATQVMKFAPPIPVPLDITGQLELSIESLQYAAPYCRSGKGNLVWNTDQIGTPLAPLELGPVIADLSCKESNIKVMGKQRSQQVMSEFSLDLQANHQYSAKAWFNPQPEFPDALAEQLKWLPTPDNQGRYQFSYRGRL